MNEELENRLEADFEHITLSSDKTKVVAAKKGEEKAMIFHAETGEMIAEIQGEFRQFAWISHDTKILATDFRVTIIYDAKTGEKKQTIEATYEPL